ncbi:helix-turn-helix domain-containing protein [Nonomuraea sp. NPDC004702]
MLLHKALESSGLTQSDLAKKLGYRRSAVNQVFRGDGNVRIETLAEYLHEMGFELDAHLVPAGEHRAAFERKKAASVRLIAPSSGLEVRSAGLALAEALLSGHHRPITGNAPVDVVTVR